MRPAAAAATRPAPARGRRVGLPEAALCYAEGRLLADLVADDRPAGDRAAEPRAGREARRPVPPRSVPA
jgi:hypothetical protein